MQAGRTKHLALQLAAFHVFKPMKYLQANKVVPSRGLSARLWQTQEPHPWVFIVDTFSRWGKQLADVESCLIAVGWAEFAQWSLESVDNGPPEPGQVENDQGAGATGCWEEADFSVHVKYVV